MYVSMMMQLFAAYFSPGLLVGGQLLFATVVVLKF